MGVDFTQQLTTIQMIQNERSEFELWLGKRLLTCVVNSTPWAIDDPRIAVLFRSLTLISVNNLTLIFYLR